MGSRSATMVRLSRLLGRLTTRRAALLALVVAALALSIAVPLRTYFSQKADLHNQLAQQQSLEAQLSQLQQQQAQLSDTAEVKAQARERLHYVMPGETPYVVQLPGDTGGTAPSAPSAPASTGAWYQQLWSSAVGSP
jgi:cell division protein FtsB